MMRHGCEALSTVDLLTVLIGSGGKEMPAQEIAARLLARTEGLPGLARIDPVELADQKGIGSSLACRLVAAVELGRRAMQPAGKRLRIQSPEDAAAILLPRYRHRSREHFGIVLLNARNAVIRIQVIAVGSLNASLVHPRELFRPAIIQRAARLILFHNHPSGDPTPSPEDVALTGRLIELGKTLGIEVVDHVILGDGRFESLRDGGTCMLRFTA